MLSFSLSLISLLLLALTCYQDIRSRAVSVVLFPLLLLCFAGMALSNVSTEALYQHLLFHVLFLGGQLVLLYAYFWMRNKRYTAVIGESMGWGDVLFWLVSCTLFSPANFIVFFLTGLLFSLLLHLLLRFFLKETTYQDQVPLAGFQALYLSLLLLLQLAYPGIRLQDDYLVLSMLV